MVGLPKSELPMLRNVFRDGWYFIFVIILLVVLLLVMKRENWAPWLATALLLVLNQLFSPQRWGRKQVLMFTRAMAGCLSSWWPSWPASACWSAPSR